jgi:hypothetical protein
MAELQLPYLAEQTNKQRILSALNRLPRSLDNTYDATVSRITAQPNPENVELALKALMWLTFAREHLQVKALQHALTVKDDTKDIDESDLPNVQMLISLCVGLVAMEPESDTIHLIHETTQQYLQSYFRKEKEDRHAEIANVCLRYFSFPAFSRVPLFGLPGWSVYSHLQTLFGLGLMESWLAPEYRTPASYPLSSYAVKYWSVHIPEGGLEGQFIPTILKTFESQCVRDSIYRLSQWSHSVKISDRPMLSLLHLASLHGLSILCRELLRPASKIQSVYVNLL